MAYVLGFFAADGYITVNKRGGQFWCIQITDKELLEEIKGVIGSEHKISVRIRKKVTESTQYRLQIGSFEMCNDLRYLGYSEKKTKSLAVPNIPKKYLFTVGIRFYLAYFSFIISALLRGQITAVVKGVLVSVCLLPKKIYERHLIQSKMKVSPDYIWNIMTHDLPPNAEKLMKIRSKYRKLMRK